MVTIIYNVHHQKTIQNLKNISYEILKYKRCSSTFSPCTLSSLAHPLETMIPELLTYYVVRGSVSVRHGCITDEKNFSFFAFPYSPYNELHF